MSLAPGIHDGIPAETYHADPAAPSLSASIAALMCSRSPLHAWAAHPRLNPGHERTEEQKFDVGTAAHAMLLQGDDICTVCDFADWRTNAAKDARDEARADGRIPLLSKDWERVQAMVAAARGQLEAVDASPPLFTDGKPEQTLIWEEAGVLCRARCDWLRDDHAAIDDLKTTGASAHPRDWSQRRLWDIGADIQMAFYRRGLKALTGVDAQFRWGVVENTPPFALSVVSLAPDALALADTKVNWAIETWRECLKTGEWSGYFTQIAYAETPPWIEMQWLEMRELETQEA